MSVVCCLLSVDQKNHFLLNFLPLFVMYKIKAYYYKINGNIESITLLTDT